MGVTDYLPRRRYRLIALITAVVLAVAAAVAASLLFDPAPPRIVTMTTGPDGSAYAEYGPRYRAIFAREGIELRLLPSAGSLENIARLQDPRAGVSVGFAQGGVTNQQRSPDLLSLGTLFYEPLWFFYRGAELERGLAGLRGKRISIGPEGSGTRALTLELFARNGIDRSFAELLPFTPQEAGEKLLSGEIQAAIMLTSWESPVVRKLVSSEAIDLASFPRAEAYTALYPFLTRLVVPAGVGDLAKNRPPNDTVLLAPKASLIVRSDLHPAIQYLLLDAASEIHAGPAMFQREGQFPAAESIDLPLSDNARQFYKSGRPFLQRYLPFWIAVLAARLLVLLIPVVGVLYPIIRLMQTAFGWTMRRRIFRFYGELKFIEIQLERRSAEQDAGDLLAQLNRLEERANHLRVPVSFTQMLYTLRDHIRLVRDRLQRR